MVLHAKRAAGPRAHRFKRSLMFRWTDNPTSLGANFQAQAKWGPTQALVAALPTFRDIFSVDLRPNQWEIKLEVPSRLAVMIPKSEPCKYWISPFPLPFNKLLLRARSRDSAIGYSEPYALLFRPAISNFRAGLLIPDHLSQPSRAAQSLQ